MRHAEITLRGSDFEKTTANEKLTAIKTLFEPYNFSSTDKECRFVIRCNSLDEVEKKLWQLESTGVFCYHIISFHGNRNGTV